MLSEICYETDESTHSTTISTAVMKSSVYYDSLMDMDMHCLSSSSTRTERNEEVNLYKTDNQRTFAGFMSLVQSLKK
jgi:hypothetical protein